MVCQLHFDLILSEERTAAGVLVHQRNSRSCTVIQSRVFQTLDKAGAFFPNYQARRRYNSKALKTLKNWPKDD